MKKISLIVVLILLLMGGSVYFVKLLKSPIKQNGPTLNLNTIGSLIVVLSPHFDDGVLSLGGLMARRDSQLLVATFFTKRPTEIVHTNWDRISGFSDSDKAIFTRTKENENALTPFSAIIKNYDYPDFQYRKENKDSEIKEQITKDIENLIETYQDRELFIYGPATFGPKITHPDHQIVHDAFMDVWKKNIRSDAHFLIYEDLPYIWQFAMSNQKSLNTYLEQKENMKFEENPLELNKSALLEKITAIYEYKSQIKAFRSFGDDIGVLAKKFFKERCRTLLPKAYACEVVYSSF